MNRILTKKTESLRRLATEGLKLGAGAVLSAIPFFNLANPFGIAFASVCPGAGAIGAALGYILRGADVVRNLTALVSVCLLRFLFRNTVEKKAGIHTACAIYTVWAGVVGSLAGVFNPSNDLRNSVFYVVASGAGAAAAYVFSVVLDKNGQARPGKRRALCFCVTAAMLFSGLAYLEGIGKSCSVILSVTSVFFVCAKCGLYNVCMYSLILAMATFLQDGTNAVLPAVIVFGAITASLVKRLGKYAVVICFLLADTVFCIYFGGEKGSFSLLFHILAAGVLFFIFPMTKIGQMIRAVSPFPVIRAGEPVAAGKKTTGFFGKISTPSKKTPFYEVCDKCGKRFVCWIKDYDYTLETLNKMTVEAADETFTVPHHFQAKCPNFDKIVRKLRRTSDDPPLWKLDYAKASHPRRGQIICGDTCGIFDAVDGKKVFCITDGMGSGSGAAKQSVRATKLLQRLICNGIEKSDALKLLNETFIKGDEEAVVGVDICSVDLRLGKCDFIKAGAAKSFIIRNGKVFSVGAASTPLGIIDETDIITHNASLCRGDILIMVSDGMTGAEEWLTSALETVAQSNVRNCVDICDALLTGACRKNMDGDDDISVITVKADLITDQKAAE